MDKKSFKLYCWSSIVLISILFPLNYFLYDFEIDLFSNRILILILALYLFVIVLLYFKNFFRFEIEEKTIKKIDNLKISLNAAKYVVIGMAIFAWFSSVFIFIIILYAFFFKLELFDDPFPNTLIYLGIFMAFIAVIWFFFTGLIFYIQSKVYSSLGHEKLN